MKCFAGNLDAKLLSCALAAISLFFAGCATPEQTAALGVGGVVLAGAQAPTHEVEQIYYLGVFDPEEQIPPSIYRVTVHGQSSFLNTTHFASGWVPASVIDSLSGQVSVDANANTAASVTAPDAASQASLNFGRRLVMFGPEGFREAPRNQRLVIVMGSDPSKFFDSVNQALGEMTSVSQVQNNSQIQQQLALAYQFVRNSQQNISEFQLEVSEELPKPFP